jgi:hypothetical protein
MGIPAFLQSEFSLTPAGTKNPGQVNLSPHEMLDKRLNNPQRNQAHVGMNELLSTIVFWLDKADLLI